MEEIIINGINLNELNTQINSIRKESSQLIAENIELAQGLTKTLSESENKEEIEVCAVKAYAALNKANFISKVSGVQFNLPFNSSYSGYYDEDTLSAMLDNSENEVLNEVLEKNEDLKKLLNLAYDMEYQSLHWNSSVC